MILYVLNKFSIIIFLLFLNYTIHFDKKYLNGKNCTLQGKNSTFASKNSAAILPMQNCSTILYPPNYIVTIRYQFTNPPLQDFLFVY